MAHETLTRGIEVYEVGGRRLYVKEGARTFAISEDDLTPEELVAIAGHITSRPIDATIAEAGGLAVRTLSRVCQ
jgi:hypothetical protein